MLSDPRITIGMPVYNGAEYVGGAIHSLLSQTERDFFLLISDDCSDDETPSICESFAARDFRIRFVRQRHHVGMTGNFNFVLDEATSPFFMWAAQDDLWAPEFLEVTLDLLLRDPSTVAATTAVIASGGIRLTTERISEQMADEDPVIRARSVNPHGYHAIYALFRRELLVSTEVRLQDVPAPDVAFVFGVALHGRIVSSEEALSTKRYIGYEAILAPDGRVVWEKALGPDGWLYARGGWARTHLCRAMLRHTYSAPITLAGKAGLSGHIFSLWLSFIHQNLIFQTGRLPVVNAWGRRRYLKGSLLALGGALLRPQKAFREARTILKGILGRC